MTQKKMAKKARAALLASIEHWHQNLDMLILNYLSGQPLSLDISTDASNCPLCACYNKASLDDEFCVACPICQHTEGRWCAGSPYAPANYWLQQAYQNVSSRSVIKDYEIGYERISAELEFLYSLLPENQQ
jgi:hypothetical protein